MKQVKVKNQKLQKVLDVERSTNLVDWETVLTTNDVSHIFVWADDTNPPPDRAFYRTKLTVPGSE